VTVPRRRSFEAQQHGEHPFELAVEVDLSRDTLSFVVFTFGSLLVALQIASGQMTPRIIATILVRDNVVRYTTGLFIFTLLFAISAINRIQASVFQLVEFVAACLGVLCFMAFLFLIDYASRLLDPLALWGA
jgi:uncharacterized membrane protein